MKSNMIPEIAAVNGQREMEAIFSFLQEADSEGSSAHNVEEGLHTLLMDLGRSFLETYFITQGDGDVGETLALADGRTAQRGDLRRRTYRSIYGSISFQRFCYGDGDVNVFPLDAQLNLPERNISYLMQKLVEKFCTQDSFAEATENISDLLGSSVAVRTAEDLSREAAVDIEEFRETLPSPAPADEGELLILAVDGKGVPLTRPRNNNDQSQQTTRRKKGEKASKKKMACVTTVYTVDRFERTAEDVVGEVIHRESPSKRPKPQNKQVRADLVGGKQKAFEHLRKEKEKRGGEGKPVIALADGERGLWKKIAEYLPGVIGILDLFHVMEKLWTASYCFHAEGSEEAGLWVKSRLKMLLTGKVGYLIGGLKQMKTKHKLKGKKEKILQQIIGYFERNREHMRYDEYIREGYPIGSGVVEGACRNLVKDRMERTGMRWVLEGAQAMLDLRAEKINGQWNAFWDFHINKEQERIYRLIPDNIDDIKKAA